MFFKAVTGNQESIIWNSPASFIDNKSFSSIAIIQRDTLKSIVAPYKKYRSHILIRSYTCIYLRKVYQLVYLLILINYRKIYKRTIAMMLIRFKCQNLSFYYTEFWIFILIRLKRFKHLYTIQPCRSNSLVVYTILE